MKKTISLVLSVCILLSLSVLLAGCGKQTVRVESLLKIDDTFSGSREISFIFPKGAELADLEFALKENLPDSDDGCYSLDLATTTDYGMKYTFKTQFNSQQDYVEKMSQLAGRDVAVYMAQPDSILTKGTRMTEDFDVKDITSWFTNIVKSIEETKSCDYQYVSNLVNINGEIFSTDTTINVKDVTGYEINSITIETTNNKNNLYERRFIFSIPEKTYKELSQQLVNYFEERTDSVASYSDWVQKGNSFEYEVIYQNVSLEELNILTNKMLDVNDCIIEYGDKTNSSTPLSEGLVFEEKLDLFAFMGKDKEPVPVYYKYSLPTTTTHSDGVVLDKGVWSTAGQWSDGTYSLDIDKSVVSVHIPDGIQYSIEGIDFTLESKGNNCFAHTTSFLFNKDTGADGCEYADNFFKNKNAQSEVISDGKHLECKVTVSGNFSEISSELIRIFGGGNYIDYEKNEFFANISNKPQVTEYINLGYMLTSENAQKPMTYRAISTGGESVISVNTKSEKISDSTQTQNDDGYFTADTSGISTVCVTYNAWNASGIVLYSVIGSVMILATVFAVFMMTKKPKKPVKDSEKHANAPTQTTTFSISELSSLSDVMGREKREKHNDKE